MKDWHYIALGAAAAVGVAALTPFRVRRDENETTFDAALYRLSKKTDPETGDKDYTLSFRCPVRKDEREDVDIVAPEEAVVTMDETAEQAPVEEEHEIVVDETAEAKAPAEEAPVEE